MSQPIYTVSSVYIEQDVDFTSKISGKKSKETIIRRSRCWGFYLSKKKAVAAAEGNYGDMCEAGYYTHIVVEQHNEGVLDVPTLVGWWEFKRLNDLSHEVKTVSCPTPKGMEQVVGFGM